MVGATQVIFPDREAAKRITPMLASSLLFNYLPISENLALAEVKVNGFCLGKTLIDSNLRKDFGLNVVAMRKIDTDDFQFIRDPSYVFTEEDELLVAGGEDGIAKYSSLEKSLDSRSSVNYFKSLFPKW